MKATEQCFPVVLFIILYKVVLTFESVDEILTVQTLPRKAMVHCCLLYCGTVNDNDRNENRTFSF